MLEVSLTCGCCVEWNVQAARAIADLGESMASFSPLAMEMDPAEFRASGVSGLAGHNHQLVEDVMSY
jgi:hypothetical protein